MCVFTGVVQESLVLKNTVVLLVPVEGFFYFIYESNVWPLSSFNEPRLQSQPAAKEGFLCVETVSNNYMISRREWFLFHSFIL